ncbi:MAG: zinc metalloprotease HtpX [Thermoplasmata archaeon HGW-Thermoplasmata-1]|nr:MAG: zinc metalloprotease HtpX [Thermoplasmata archaeon HGW-Thermoplasmata-1]
MAKSMMLEDQIRHNKAATFWICLFMLVLLFGIGFAVGYLWGAPPLYATAIVLPICLLYILITYSFSVQSVLAAAKARPANPNNRLEKLLIYRVEEMSIAAGIPMPKVYVQESSDINAFATGKKPENSVVCVTTGALEKLNQEELEGVIAHEMSHIKNRDILVATVTVGVVGAIALIAEILLRSLFFGAGRGRSSRKGGPEQLILLVVAIAFAILAPLFAKMTQLWISRKREYLADSSGAYITRNPDGLASALEKIRASAPDNPKGSKTVASLYIANPFRRNVEKSSLWATHPPLNERIRRLRSM